MADDIRREITIQGSIQEVWRAVTEDLGAWLAADVEVEARVGRPISVRWPDGTTSRGLVEVVEPPRRFAFRWRWIADDVDGIRIGEPTRVQLVLHDAGEGRTLVAVTESEAPLPDRPLALSRCA
ncbi:MAG: hypothetical protein E6G47_01630 [Actinobacteria bacterium]|nr:MAG: hypothetical protein E6G47_01630 [Actinomycetota bacterium]